MIAALDWQEVAVLVLGGLGIGFAVWLGRRRGGGHDCRRCAHLRTPPTPRELPAGRRRG